MYVFMLIENSEEMGDRAILSSNCDNSVESKFVKKKNCKSQTDVLDVRLVRAVESFQDEGDSCFFISVTDSIAICYKYEMKPKMNSFLLSYLTAFQNTKTALE